MERRRDLVKLTKEHIVNEDSNYCFGEGGAGTFSDGKLYTRSKKRGDVNKILDVLIMHGATPEIRIDCGNDDEKFEIVKGVKEFFINNYNCNEIDGIRIKFSNGWGLLRASNTQPVLVCRFEADNYNDLQEYKNIVINKINSFGDLNINVWTTNQIL